MMITIPLAIDSLRHAMPADLLKRAVGSPMAAEGDLYAWIETTYPGPDLEIVAGALQDAERLGGVAAGVYCREHIETVLCRAQEARERWHRTPSEDRVLEYVLAVIDARYAELDGPLAYLAQMDGRL